MDDLSQISSLGIEAGTKPGVSDMPHVGESAKPQDDERSPRDSNLVCIACEPGGANRGIPHLLLGTCKYLFIHRHAEDAGHCLACHQGMHRRHLRSGNCRLKPTAVSMLAPIVGVSDMPHTVGADWGL